MYADTLTIVCSYLKTRDVMNLCLISKQCDMQQIWSTMLLRDYNARSDVALQTYRELYSRPVTYDMKVHKIYKTKDIAKLIASSTTYIVCYSYMHNDTDFGISLIASVDILINHLAECVRALDDYAYINAYFNRKIVIKPDPYNKTTIRIEYMLNKDKYWHIRECFNVSDVHIVIHKIRTIASVKDIKVDLIEDDPFLDKYVY